MQYNLQKPGFWLSAFLTLMAVMVQTAISLPLGMADQALRNAGWAIPSLVHNPFVVGLVNIVAFGVAIMVGLVFNQLQPLRAFPFKRPTLIQVFSLFLVVFGADLLLSEADNLFRTVATPPEWLTEAYKVLLSPESGWVGRFFLLVIVAPVTEELLFRGIILRGLLTRFPGWVAVGLAAFFFAAGHVNPWQFISAFWIGVAFGWFYLRTRSLTLCILGHAVSNGLFLIFTSQLFDIPGLTTSPDNMQEVMFQPWWLDVSGAVLLAVGIYTFMRVTPDPEPPTMFPENQPTGNATMFPENQPTGNTVATPPPLPPAVPFSPPPTPTSPWPLPSGGPPMPTQPPPASPL